MHILTHLHPTNSLSNLIKDIKLGSSDFIKKHHSFPNFKGWQHGYAAFTYTITEKKRLITYIKNQQKHHETVTYKEELIGLLNEHNIAFEEKYLL